MISAFQGSQLFYHQLGSGPKPLLLFHGFGQSHDVFIPFAESLRETHTCYSFDLYFHGQSIWNDGELPLEKAAWKAIISKFLDDHHIQKFSVGGFSLGGKLALALIEAFPDRIESTYLIAPDGIKTSFWYSLATYPSMFRNIFKSMITKPGRFFSLANFFRRIGIVDKGLIRFATSQMATHEQRERVYYTWTVFRRFNFDMKSLAMIINANKIDTHLVAGEFDKVIKPKNMNRLLKYLHHQNLHILPAGHNGLLRIIKAESLKQKAESR